MTKSREASRDSSPTRETKEVKEKNDSSKNLVHNPIKEGTTRKPSETLETKLRGLEEKNQQLKDIKHIKQQNKDEETRFYQARAIAIENNALYEGKLDEYPGDERGKTLVNNTSEFLDHLFILDTTDINNPSNFTKSINSYQKANTLANDMNLYRLEKEKIREWELDKTGIKTIREIWQETTQQDNKSHLPIIDDICVQQDTTDNTTMKLNNIDGYLPKHYFLENTELNRIEANYVNPETFNVTHIFIHNDKNNTYESISKDLKVVDPNISKDKVKGLFNENYGVKNWVVLARGDKSKELKYTQHNFPAEEVKDIPNDYLRENKNFDRIKVKNINPYTSITTYLFLHKCNKDKYPNQDIANVLIKLDPIMNTTVLSSFISGQKRPYWKIVSKGKKHEDMIDL